MSTEQLMRTRANNAVVSAIPASTSAVQLLARDENREGFYITNDSTADLYIKFGEDASTTDFSLKLGAGLVYESPALTYVGIISGVWSAADGNARVTDLKG